MLRKSVLGSLCLFGGALLVTASPAQADLLFFTNQDEFNAALANAGKILKGTEDFPWFAANNAVVGVDDPVNGFNSWPGWYDVGTLMDNLSYQSNTGGADSSQEAPAGAAGIALFTQDFVGAVHNGLVTNTFVNGFDIISGDHTAYGLNVVTLLGGTSVNVNVYDTSNALVGTMNGVSAPVSGGFLGILATGNTSIGRINLFDPDNGAEGLYGVDAYLIPAPGALALLGLAGLVARRRRRA